MEFHGPCLDPPGPLDPTLFCDSVRAVSQVLDVAAIEELLPSTMECRFSLGGSVPPLSKPCRTQPHQRRQRFQVAADNLGGAATRRMFDTFVSRTSDERSRPVSGFWRKLDDHRLEHHRRKVFSIFLLAALHQDVSGVLLARAFDDRVHSTQQRRAPVPRLLCCCGTTSTAACVARRICSAAATNDPMSWPSFVATDHRPGERVEDDETGTPGSSAMLSGSSLHVASVEQLRRLVGQENIGQLSTHVRPSTLRHVCRAQSRLGTDISHQPGPGRVTLPTQTRPDGHGHVPSRLERLVCSPVHPPAALNVSSLRHVLDEPFGTGALFQLLTAQELESPQRLFDLIENSVTARRLASASNGAARRPNP